MGMKLGPTGSYITIEPTYNYEQIETLDRKDLRSKEGGLFTYLAPGSFTKFKIPLSWVNSSDRALVNSWWRTGTNVEFVPDTAVSSTFFTCRVMDNKEPFRKFVEPYYQTFYQGKIILETV